MCVWGGRVSGHLDDFPGLKLSGSVSCSKVYGTSWCHLVIAEALIYIELLK